MFTALSAGEALSILSREAVDVVILDIRLPDMDGFEFLLKLTRSYPVDWIDRAHRFRFRSSGDPFHEARRFRLPDQTLQYVESLKGSFEGI